MQPSLGQDPFIDMQLEYRNINIGTIKFLLA